jgi:hypothetical protein
MNKAALYQEVKDADYIMKTMWEDLFGHRVTQWSPQDTARLHNKLILPVTDKDKEAYIKMIEPIMQQKSIIPTKRTKYLDSFLDLYTRVDPDDLTPDKDDDADQLNALLGIDTD